MFKFLIKLLIVPIVSIVILFCFFKKYGNGYTDYFYLRFTTPQANSLIIGTSRSAQGIIPSIINENLKGLYSPLFNYSFTVAHSPFGPAYLKSIKKKLCKNSQKSLFIVSVDPWAISIDKSKVNDKLNRFSEEKTFIGKLNFVNSKPNFEYLLFYYNKPFYSLIQKNPWGFLHNDGWLEMNVPMDSMKVEKRIREKMATYSEYINTKILSNERYQSLIETIRFLKKHGDVYLVRIPVSKQMAYIEKQYMPEFDSLMDNLSSQYHIAYINFFNSNNFYQTTDGNHLYKKSSMRFSKELSRKIKEIKETMSY